MGLSSENLFLTNTFSGKKELFTVDDPKKVTLYVCGITPYDYAHVGHGRCYATFDVLYRLLAFLGYDTVYCRNFTDIDDKLLMRAQKECGDQFRYKELASFYSKAYEQDMQRLGCKKPTYEPRVTDHIGPIITFVEQLVAAGHAYVVDGDVYFSIKTFAPYGQLSKRKREDLLAGARVAVNEKKRDPLDFALWKGEPVGSFWESPWGYGRPGWHIECSTLARLYLGDQIDIHGGGMDLIFPHHENESAQSQALLSFPFVRYWVHNAFVRINQEKMSKSLGNFFTLRDLYERFDPMVIRYLFLQHHYRNPLDFSFDDFPGIQKSYDRLCRLVEGSGFRGSISYSELSVIGRRMVDFLCDDLNVPGMLGVIFEHFKEIQDSSELKMQTSYILKELGGLTLEPLVEQVVALTPEAQQLIQEREQARQRKDWVTADALRDKLKTLGIEVQDKKI